jgi:hypothetical protein
MPARFDPLRTDQSGDQRDDVLDFEEPENIFLTAAAIPTAVASLLSHPLFHIV